MQENLFYNDEYVEEYEEYGEEYVEDEYEEEYGEEYDEDERGVEYGEDEYEEKSDKWQELNQEQSEIVITRDQKIPFNAFFDNTDLKLVKICEGVEIISSYAFSNCSFLKKVILPQSLTTIGDGAFEECSRLTDINLPEGLLEIGMDTFSKCESLQYIYIPEGVKVIGSGAFLECTALKRIVLPHSLEIIEDNAFENCCNLEIVEGAGSIKRIGSSAFSGCDRLSEFPFTSTLEYIGDNAFWGSIKVPNNIWTIKNLSMDETILEVPNGTTTITASSFARVSGIPLKQIILPQSLKNISKDAFDFGETSIKTIHTYEDTKEERLARFPKKMNMPKNYFRQKTAFDYEMAFLLADTLWKDYVTDRDFENMILYQDSETAQYGARRRLSENCNAHLKYMLAHTNNSPLQYEHIAAYAAAYASKIDINLLNTLKKRALKNKAYKAEKILEKFCFSFFMPSLDSKFLSAFTELEMYEADVYFENNYLININYSSVRWKNSKEYVPDIIVKGVLYAYFKQFNVYNSKGINKFEFTSDIYRCEAADSIVEEFDRKSFEKLLYGFDKYDRIILICRFGNDEEIAELLDYYIKRYSTEMEFGFYSAEIHSAEVEFLKKALVISNNDAVIKAINKIDFIDMLNNICRTN